MDAFQTDEQLMTALNSGNRQAFEMIYRQHITELYRYARRNVKIQEDCEEIVQDVFASLWARHKEIRIKTIRYYLLDMVKYKVIRYFQHRNAKKNYAEHFRLFEAIYQAHQDEENALDSEEFNTLLQKSVEKLPARVQAVFNLRMTENLTNSEIALRMNIKKVAVENYMLRAINKIRLSYQASRIGNL